MTDPWFKPKRYGYGASPANWKGWAETLGFCAIVLGFTHVLIVQPAAEHAGPSGAQVIAFLALFAGSIVAFIRLCKAKTDGDWRWRWGKDEGGEP